jgi:hypothetical protein
MILPPHAASPRRGSMPIHVGPIHVGPIHVGGP